MNLSLDDTTQMALVGDWNAEDWAAQSSSIPDTYTIQFQPSLNDTDLQSLNTGRAVVYQPQIVYEVQPLGDNGYTSTPSTVYVQQLLPKQS